MTVPLQWTGERDGQYRGTFVSTEAGAYEINVDATRAGGQAVGSGVTYVRAAASEAEYFDPTMHAAPLRRIAEETGGKFYTTRHREGHRRRRALRRTRRDLGRGARALEHADHPDHAHGTRLRGVGLPPHRGVGLMLKAFLLIVVGLAGDPEHGKTFHKWGTTLAEASERLGVPKERLVYLVDQPGEGDTRVSGRATRDEIGKAIDGFSKQAGPEDVVFIMLIGHGSFDGRDSKFNLPGPDMAAADFNLLLKRLPTKQVVLVNASSASGPFIEDCRRRAAPS